MRRTAISASALAVASLVAACGGGSSTAKNPATGSQGANTVVLQDIQFKPSANTVKVGEAVTWQWKDPGVPHNVVADDNSFTSGDPKTSGSFKHTFAKTGTFKYKCVVHSTMTGTVTVR